MNALRTWRSQFLRFPGNISRLCSSMSAQIERPLSQPTHFTHAALMKPTEVTPGISRDEYISRRTALAGALPIDSFSVFPSNPLAFMSEDVPYLYHHNSDLAYIAGITEPGSLLVAERSTEATRFILFVEARNADRELWDGPLCGTGEDVRSYFGVDEVRAVDSLPDHIASSLPGLASFHFDASVNPKITSVLRKLSPSDQRTLVSKWDEQKPKSFLLKHRLVKSNAEIDLLRQSASIMSASFNDAIARARLSPDVVYERHVEALLEYGCKTKGATRMAFPCVVASGINGTILHYMRNDSTARDGDFVMVDAGCEVHGYSSDISRSWPVSGRFSSPQRDLYDLVLSVQKQCIDLAVQDDTAKSNETSLNSIHFFAVTKLVDGLRQLGFFPDHSLESAVASGAYSKYFPHATGHYLGMDVHDTHLLDKDIALRDGMVITIEPGLYCREDDESAPVAFRGIGMRIEDDVVVGKPGAKAEVLSSDSVKEPQELEQLIGCFT